MTRRTVTRRQIFDEILNSELGFGFDIDPATGKKR
jgi:hypothetical protein